MSETLRPSSSAATIATVSPSGCLLTGDVGIDPSFAITSCASCCSASGVSRSSTRWVMKRRSARMRSRSVDRAPEGASQLISRQAPVQRRARRRVQNVKHSEQSQHQIGLRARAPGLHQPAVDGHLKRLVLVDGELPQVVVRQRDAAVVEPADQGRPDVAGIEGGGATVGERGQRAGQRRLPQGLPGSKWRAIGAEQRSEVRKVGEPRCDRCD